MNLIHTKKFRHGSVSLGLTVVVIAAVILFNAIFSVFSEKYQWYIDMTPEPVFTLSDKAKDLLTQVDPTHDVTILFCDEKDEDGKTILGIRYNEALALECAYQRRELQQLTMRMSALERG